jgi:TolB-like protein
LERRIFPAIEAVTFTLWRSIAVMFFQNQTGDQNLQWLQKGLTEMFIRALSQSRSLSVLSTERLHEILDRISKGDAPKSIDLDMAAIVAQEANVEAILVGNITKSGDELKINVKLKLPNQGLVLREESVEGSGSGSYFCHGRSINREN